MTTQDLIARLEGAGSGGNELDVLIEVALFEPDEEYLSCRANIAGTKVIYSLRDGREEAYWAPQRDPTDAIAILRAQSAEPAKEAVAS